MGNSIRYMYVHVHTCVWFQKLCSALPDCEIIKGPGKRLIVIECHIMCTGYSMYNVHVECTVSEYTG